MECQCSTISSIPLILKQWIMKMCLRWNIEPPAQNILEVTEFTLLLRAILKNYRIALKCINLPENTITFHKSAIYEDIEEPLGQNFLLPHCRYSKYCNEINVESQLLFLLDLYILFYGKGIVWHFWKDYFKARVPFPSTHRKCDSKWTITTFQENLPRIYQSKFSALCNSVNREHPNNCDIGMISLIRDNLLTKKFITIEKQNAFGFCHIYPQTWKSSERAVHLQQKVNLLMVSAYQTMRNESNYNVVSKCIQKMSTPECALKIYLSKDYQQCNFYKNLHTTASVDNTISNKENDTQHYTGRSERFKANMKRKEEDLKRKTHQEAINGICAQIVTDILDISMKLVAYRSRGETISEYATNKWRELFCAGEAVNLKWQDSVSELISKKIDFQEKTEGQQEVINKMELMKYIEERGKWQRKYESKSCREPRSQPFLANILANLQNLKQTTQETKKLKNYPVTAIVVGLEDLQLLQIIRQQLNGKKILSILPSEVISLYISNYLLMNANVLREDCSFWECITENLNSVEISQKYSRQFKNSIKSELKKMSLLRENKEINIWDTNISSRENKFTLNTELNYGTNMVYAAKLARHYFKISKLEPEKLSEDSKLSRKPLDILTTKYQSGNRMDSKVQYGKLAYQSLCLGANIDDSILVGMILEYVKEMDPEEGWVLFNFPETKQQAVLLEEVLTQTEVPQLQEEEYHIHGQATPSSMIHKLGENSERMGSVLVKIASKLKWKPYFKRYINASPPNKINYTALDSFYEKKKIFYRLYPQDATKVYSEEIIRVATEIELISNNGNVWPSSNEKSPMLSVDSIKVASKTLTEECIAENTRPLLDGVQSRCLIKEPSCVNLKMPNTIRHMLALFWEVLENDFLIKINLMLTGLKLHNEIHSQCLSSVERRFCIFVEQPGELQVFLNRFQILLTIFDDEAINDLDIANHLFTKWWEMKEEMHRSLDERNKENIRFLHCLMKDMTETDHFLSSIYLIGLEAEVSRCSKTLQIINDYYYATVKGRPSGFSSKWFHFLPLTKKKENSNIEKDLQSGSKIIRNYQREEKISQETESKRGVKKGDDSSKKRNNEGQRKTTKEDKTTKNQKQRKNSLLLEDNDLEKQIKEAVITSRWGKGEVVMTLMDNTLARFQSSTEKLEKERVTIVKYIENLEKKLSKKAEEMHCKDKKNVKKKKKKGASNEELQQSSDSSLSSSDTDISILEEELWSEKAVDGQVWVEWKCAVEEEVERAKQALDSIRGALEENMINLQRELSTLVKSLDSMSKRWLQNERHSISLASDYLLHAILKKANRCHYISFWDLEGNWLLANKSTAPTSAATCFCLCQLDHLRCHFIQFFPKGLIQNTSFASILYETTKTSLCFEEHFTLNLWNQLSYDEMEMIVQKCYGNCNWINWRDFLTQALALPKPTVGELVDAVNRFKKLDSSLSGSLPFEDYCNVTLWFERGGDFDDREQKMAKMPYSLETPTKSQWERSKLPSEFKMSPKEATEEKQRGDFMDTYKEERLNLGNQNLENLSLEKRIQKTLDDPHRRHPLIESNKYVSQELPLAHSSLLKRVQNEATGMTSRERMVANGGHSGIKSEGMLTEIAVSGYEMKSRGAERNRYQSDTSIACIKLVKRQLFETFQDRNGRVNYRALLLAFCKDEDAEEGLRKAISLYAGKTIHIKDDVVDNTMRSSKIRWLLGEDGKIAVHPAEKWIMEGHDKNRIVVEDLMIKEMVRDDAEKSDSTSLHSSSFNSHAILSKGTQKNYQTVSMNNELNIHELEHLNRNPGHTLMKTSTVASTAKLKVKFRKKLGKFQCHQPMQAFKSCSIGHLDLEEQTITKLHSDSYKGREDPSELRKYHLDNALDFSESSCPMTKQVTTNIVGESLWQNMDPSATSAPSTEIGKSQNTLEGSATSSRSEKELPREEGYWSGMLHTHNEQEDSNQELSNGVVLERKMSKISLTGSLAKSTTVSSDIHLEGRRGRSVHEKKETLSEKEQLKVMANGSHPIPQVRHILKQSHTGENVGKANSLTAQTATVDSSAKRLKYWKKAPLSMQAQQTKTMDSLTYLRRPLFTAADILVVDSKSPQRLWLGKQSSFQECEKSLPPRIFMLKESKGENVAIKEKQPVGERVVILEEMALCTEHKFKIDIVLQLICDCLKNLLPEIGEDNSSISIYYQKVADILSNCEENTSYLQQEIDLSYLKTFLIFKSFKELNVFKQLDVNQIIRKVLMGHSNDKIHKGE